VVGRAETPSGDAHAFLYDGTTMHDLNSLLDVSGEGWTVVEARAINDAGQIAATAYNPGTGYHAVLLTPRITVSIMIRPSGSPGPINPKSHGKIPVAILSAATFDASTQVDRSSLTFGRVGDEPSLAFCSHTPTDVNGDGLPDLVCHFYTWAAGFQNRDPRGIAQAVLRGKTVSGISFSGSNSVRLVPARPWLHSLRRYWRP
jgi:probable HAF family extracellular repeat protein